MTNDNFIAVVRQPESVKTEYVVDLKEMVELYPYFVQARMLHIKALQQLNSIHYAANLNVASIYCSDRRWLYYYLHPEKKVSTEPFQRNNNRKSSGDYFDMINVIESEGGDSKLSLKNLAEKLKSARAMVVAQLVQPLKKSIINNIEIEIRSKEDSSVKSDSDDSNLGVSKDITENNAKKLIIEHKYEEAIEILKALNLNNPKKSVYFADQIRFLEKVIANSKK